MITLYPLLILTALHYIKFSNVTNHSQKNRATKAQRETMRSSNGLFARAAPVVVGEAEAPEPEVPWPEVVLLEPAALEPEPVELGAEPEELEPEPAELGPEPAEPEPEPAELKPAPAPDAPDEPAGGIGLLKSTSEAGITVVTDPKDTTTDTGTADVAKRVEITAEGAISD
jgi:hypothetical protein